MYYRHALSVVGSSFETTAPDDLDTIWTSAVSEARSPSLLDPRKVARPMIRPRRKTPAALRMRRPDSGDRNLQRFGGTTAV